MVPYARREHAKRRRDDAGASGSIVRDEWERDDNSPAPHEVVEEEVFDDMVRNLFRDDPKGMDDNDMEQEHLYNASSTPVFEGCTFSILRASLELLNIQTVYGWSNASLDALLK